VSSQVTPAPAVYAVKALTFRAYLAQIDKLGALEAVKARVPPETLHAMEEPPLPTVWMDPLRFEEMMCALEAVRGLHAVRTVSRAALDAATVPNLRPILSGLLRMFGTSPATLLTRMSDFSKPVSLGPEYEWIAEGPQGGRLIVTFPRRVPRVTCVSFESGCALILDLCRVKGCVSPTEMSGDGTRATIRVTWLA
jgi:hypothetical protein